jgi:hypothetical protein
VDEGSFKPNPMTTITLYSSHQKPTTGDSFQPIDTSAGRIWIRAYVRTGPHNDLGKALDAADPAGHEVVLNTIKAPDQSHGAEQQEEL